MLLLRAGPMTDREPGTGRLRLAVGYGSQTGNAQYLAEDFSAAAKAIGIEVQAVEMNRLALHELQDISHLVAFVSTTGDGELPYNASIFGEALAGAPPDALAHLSFAVLGLGDRSYEEFAAGGRIIDTRLEELGATRLFDRADCDEDFDDAAEAWSSAVLERLHEALIPAESATEDFDAYEVLGEAERRVGAERGEWTRRHPLLARVVENRRLTSKDSEKEVRHIVIDVAGSGLVYQAGDSLGVHPVNDPMLVEALLTQLAVPSTHRPAGHLESLGELLSTRLEIRTPSKELLVLVAERTKDDEARRILVEASAGERNTWLHGRDVLDLTLLVEDLAVDELLPTLRPLQYRDYSIASSPSVHSERIHLTVAVVRHRHLGRERGGVASTFLADRSGDGVLVHPQPNPGFRLPPDDAHLIMVGPGTGIAPFRAFLHERQRAAATGRAWLFFGARHRSTDFLYSEELHAFLETGVLTRLDLAFSRDQERRVYVQDRMSEHASELYAWLESGAYLYVCGDAERMAKDVDATLHRIVGVAGGMDPEAAHDYVNRLIMEHRYVRDVY